MVRQRQQGKALERRSEVASVFGSFWLSLLLSQHNGSQEYVTKRKEQFPKFPFPSTSQRPWPSSSPTWPSFLYECHFDDIIMSQVSE